MADYSQHGRLSVSGSPRASEASGSISELSGSVRENTRVDIGATGA